MKKNIVTILLIVSVIVNIVFADIFIKKTTTVSSDTELSYSISGYQGDPEEQLLNAINNAEETLNIAIYNLDNEEIASAIGAAAERGVTVQIIADGENTSNEDSTEILNELTELGVAVKVNTDEKMHLKLTIADNETVVTGSFNYTKDSAEDNQEVLVTIQNPELASSMNQTFEEMWASSELEVW